ncbi:MAG: hypothetical protein Q9164_007274 [Protoblastenia rupestris]
MFKSSDEPPAPEGDNNEKKWQADHVNDLGYWTTIVNANNAKPKDCTATAWATVTRAIRGAKNKEDKWQPTANSKILGKVLNDAVNIRGISYTHNQFKNYILNFGYGEREVNLSPPPLPSVAASLKLNQEFQSWNKYERSTAWFTYKYRQMTKDQYDEATGKAIDALKSFIKDDDKSAKALEEHFASEIARINKRVDDELERVLEKAPDTGDNFFKEDDCANTRYTPPDGGDDSAQTAQSSGPAPTTVPYAEGKCNLILKQTTTDKTGVIEEYTLETQIFDNSGASIAYTMPETATPGHPLKLQSKLEDLLEMTPSMDHHGSVSFVIGQQKWDTTMNDDKKVPFAPYCEYAKNGEEKNYNCYFMCTWNHGKSSDGTN